MQSAFSGSRQRQIQRALDVASDLEPGSLRGGVLITIHRLSQGGADRVAILLANGFVAAGIPTAFVVLRGGGEGRQTLLGQLRDEVALCSAGAPMGSRHVELLRGYRHIRRQVLLARPALVLASSSNMGPVTGVVARAERGSDCRFAMKLTNPVIRPNYRSAVVKGFRRLLYGFIFGSFDSVLILSDAERAKLSSLFPQIAGRFQTVTNPYVTKEMMIKQRDARDSAHPMILTAARLMPQKRLDRLLQAFAKIADQNVLLTILGDGPERKQLEQQAQQLGIAHRVCMPGFAEDVLPWLRRASLFVLSSDYEGLPAAIFEALACSVPVVTTDSFDGARALLAGAARCAVVAREDIAALTKAMEDSIGATEPLTDLPDIALRYGIDAAIADHIQHLRLAPTAAVESLPDRSVHQR